MKRVESPQIQDKEPQILSVAETRALFRANEKVDPEIGGLPALGAFAGMRTSAIARIDYNEIDFKQGGILTPAEKTKKEAPSMDRGPARQSMGVVEANACGGIFDDPPADVAPTGTSHETGWAAYRGR